VRRCLSQTPPERKASYKLREAHLLLATLIAGALHGGIAPRRVWAAVSVAILVVFVARGRALESARAGRACR
jgi:hypothetical protein